MLAFSREPTGSPTYLIHIAGRVAGAIRQMVAEWLLQNALTNGGFQIHAVETTEGQFLPAVKAALQLAVCRYPDPAAVAAELVANGRDQTHGSFCFWQAIPPGYAAGGDGL
jgi:hypothetical protein